MYRQNYTPNQILPMWQLVLILVVLIGVMFYFTRNDHGDEQAIAADLEQAQQKAEKAARLNQILIRQCFKERGEGAAIVFGEDDKFLRCAARKGQK